MDAAKPATTLSCSGPLIGVPAIGDLSTLVRNASSQNVRFLITEESLAVSPQLNQWPTELRVRTS